MSFSSIEELIKIAEDHDFSISDIVLKMEVQDTGKSETEIMEKMDYNLQIMKEALKKGLEGDTKSASGLTGGQAKLIVNLDNDVYTGVYKNVIAYGVATAEVNACMGKIVAGPTAGSCGIIPAVILALGEKLELTDRKLCKALLTAGGLGEIIADKATLSGSEGGCQAECGSGAAMAAGAAVQLMGGTPDQVGHAFALALKNMLGLVCDPVAGLVEVPCVKRNGFAAAHALTAAGMALAGIRSVIPADEVIEAMSEIGDDLPASLKETSRGGLAVTETGKKIRDDLMQE